MLTLFCAIQGKVQTQHTGQEVALLLQAPSVKVQIQLLPIFINKIMMYIQSFLWSDIRQVEHCSPSCTDHSHNICSSLLLLSLPYL